MESESEPASQRAGGLSALERRTLRLLYTGGLLDLTTPEDSSDAPFAAPHPSAGKDKPPDQSSVRVDPATMALWGDDRSITAEFLRDVLRGRHQPLSADGETPSGTATVDPRGLRIRGARIVGRLDLANLRTTIPFTLLDCYLSRGIECRSAHLPVLNLTGCHLHGDSQPALNAEGLRSDHLNLSLTRYTGTSGGGELHLRAAHVAGQLSLSGASLTGMDTEGRSLVADGLQANGDVLMDEGFTAAGAIRLTGAHIAGQLGLSGASLTGMDTEGRSLVADGLQANGDVLMDEGFTAAGAIRLTGAHIAGQLDLRNATVNGADADGDSLIADGLLADSDVFLDEGFTAAGAVRLPGAHVKGVLCLRAAALTGADASGDSLVLESLQSYSDVLLDDGFTASGGLRMPGAHVAGQLSLRDAVLTGTNKDGYSLVAAGLQADGSMLLDEGFTAAGAIRLSGAHVAGQLDLRGATLTGADTNGDSLVADRLRADSNLSLDLGFTTTGAIRLHGAHVAGQLSLRGATLTGADADGRSLVADGLRADSDVFLDQGFTASGAVNLRGAYLRSLHVARTESQLPLLTDATGWQLEDVHGVVRQDRRAATRWLDGQTTAQPWQEFAALYDRIGQPADARWLRYRSACRSTPPAREHPFAWATRQTYRVTTGHGYYPLLALGWLIGVFLLSWVLTTSWGSDFTVASTPAIREDLACRVAANDPTRLRGSAPTDCPATPFDSIAEDDLVGPPFSGRVPAAWCDAQWDTGCLSPGGYALSVALPATSSAQPWQPPDDYRAHLYAGLRLAAWVFTALLIAGVTGLLRRQT